MTIVYHGSKERFNKFDYSRMGLNGTSEGYGFYFTSKKSIAENYGYNGYLYTVEFNGNKSLSSTRKTITRSQLKKLLIELDKEGNYLSNYGEVDYEGYNNVLQTALESEWNYNDSDVDLICSLSNAHGSRETVLRLLYRLFGYDHIKVTAEWGNSEDIENGLYIATVNECFDIVDITKL